MNNLPRTGETAASLESVLNTRELSQRPARPPDYEGENRALLAIAQQMADSPRTTLQKLVDVAMEICRAGSAGVSRLSEENGDFYWAAIAGAWKPRIGSPTPRDFGPRVVVFDRKAAQLFTHPERYDPYLAQVSPPIAEALLTPYYVAGKAAGILWVIAHDAARGFDAEDVRVLASLARFAAAAHPLCAAPDARTQQPQSLLDINEALLVSAVRQHDLTEQALAAEAKTRESEHRLALDLAASHDEVRALAANLLTAQEEERRRLSLELHDQICQQLAAVVMEIAALATRPPPRKEAQGRLKATQAHVVKALEEIHNIAHQMHPSFLDDLGLVASLQELCRQFSHSYPDVAWNFADGDLPVSVPRGVAFCLYRVAQESMQNIAKHAKARHVSVALAWERGMAVLTISDDGIGFDQAAVKGLGRIGLIGMQERARLVNGKLTITAKPGYGTQIAVEVPLPDREL